MMYSCKLLTDKPTISNMKVWTGKHDIKRGFTLVEIMVVVLIVGILLSIAVPNFMRTREGARNRECVATLRQIDNAKEFFANENGLNSGAPVAMADLWPNYIRRSTPPECMAGGTYLVNPVGTSPTCSYQSAPFPHILP